MRRMISERERAPLKNMGFDEATNTVEVGTKLEVDGKATFNDGVEIDGSLKVSNINCLGYVGANSMSANSMGVDVAQADFVTPATGITISNFSVIKMGKLLFVDFVLKNETGDTISAWTNIATIKEAYRPQTTHYHPCSSTNPVGVANLYVSTNFQYSTAIANEQSLHINCFYKIA